jgi:hypothetical protein
MSSSGNTQLAQDDYRRAMLRTGTTVAAAGKLIFFFSSSFQFIMHRVTTLCL